ncbi:methyltransferase domain-containing protein [Christensenellaceae bacterium OttesenSCG-928-K19]|nr:methyltransferase domain-containing protein [Christensenellaceae bacterium OttesenSCG-928-K19]
MKYSKTKKYDPTFLAPRMMGPNAMKLVEELTAGLPLLPGMRVMDLGCGMGLTSVFLAQEYGLQVFATDLWIPATANYQTFLAAGVSAIPIHADATDLPYADEYFDAIISVDSYHYYGREERFMDEKIASLVKPGGIIALVLPGLKEEFSVIPEEFKPYWDNDDVLATMHSLPWWQSLLCKSRSITVDTIAEMAGFDECWADWLACTDNEYAVTDKIVMDKGAGKYMNLIKVIARKK